MMNQLEIQMPFIGRQSDMLEYIYEESYTRPVTHFYKTMITQPIYLINTKSLDYPSNELNKDESAFAYSLVFL